jgi:hypothetical protein
MVRRSLRVGLWLVLVVGLAWSLRRMQLLRRLATTVDVSRDPWTPLPQPHAEPPGPTPATAVEAAKATPPTKRTQSRTWAAAQNGGCPPGHPVKAKTASRIFRVPGMSGYDQTRPDRCYRSEEEAVADGFTRAKR